MVLFSPAIGLAQAKARALGLCLVRGCQPIAPHHCPAHATVAFRACPARAPVPASARASAREHRERRRVRRLPKGGEPALLRPVQPGARMFGAINLEHCAAARALLSTWAHARAPLRIPASRRYLSVLPPPVPLAAARRRARGRLALPDLRSVSSCRAACCRAARCCAARPQPLPAPTDRRAEPRRAAGADAGGTGAAAAACFRRSAANPAR